MKKIILLILLFPATLLGQYMSHYKDGIYKSIAELKLNAPSYEWKLDMVREFKKDTIEERGIYYKLITPDHLIKKSFLRDSIFCVVKDSQIYINTFHFVSYGRGFQKVLVKSEKFYRYVEIYNASDKPKPILIGGGIRFAIESTMESNLPLYYYRSWALIDLNSEEFYELESERDMSKLLFLNHHDLFLEYKNLDDRSKSEDVLKIIDKYEQEEK